MIFLPNTDIDNASISSLGEGLGVTVSMTVVANRVMEYGRSPAATVLNATEQGFYIKPVTAFTSFSSDADTIALIIGDASPPTMFNYGISFRRIANDNWEVVSITSQAVLATGISDSEILNGNLAVSFSTDGTNITTNAYLNGTTASPPIGSETVLASSVGITDLTAPVALIGFSDRTIVEQVTIEYPETPAIIYTSITQFGVTPASLLLQSNIDTAPLLLASDIDDSPLLLESM